MRISLDSNGGRLKEWWVKNGEAVIRIAVVLMALAAVVWLTYEFWRLLWHPGRMGAIDLKQRYFEVSYWFRGQKVYGEFPWGTTYPPASHVILWPLVGWLELTAARWLWAGTTLVALAWLGYVFIRESGADSRLEKTFVGLIPFSMYATGAAIGNGQPSVHVICVLLTGLLLLRNKPASLITDITASLCILFALVKPSLSVPFFWMVLFVPGRLRPALMIVCGYITCTLFAASFQEPGIITLLQEWILCSKKILSSVAVYYSANNLHSWFTFWGIEKWLTPSSLTLLAALGVWVFMNRGRSFWTLAGVTALTARFWTYHGWYDDLLIAIPMIALFGFIKSGKLKDNDELAAGILLGLILLSTMAPGGLYLFQQPLKQVYVTGQLVIWVSALGFFLRHLRIGTDNGTPGISDKGISLKPR